MKDLLSCHTLNSDCRKIAQSTDITQSTSNSQIVVPHACNVRTCPILNLSVDVVHREQFLETFTYMYYDVGAMTADAYII